MLLSLGATFASDDVDGDVIAIDDEITVDDEVLAVEDDTQALSEDNSAPASSIIITNDNIDDYIDGSGAINENITADELIFEGTFENLNLSVDRPIKVTGDKAILINPFIDIDASNVTFSGFTINQTKHINAIFVGGLEENPISDVTISDVKIDFKDIGEAPENIAVEVINTNNFNLINSAINYVGATDGSYVNNAISIKNSNVSRISGNKFKISLVSSAVPWVESPAGSGNWVSSPVSEGIVIDSSSDVKLKNNTIDLTYNGVVGDFDTIYAVDFKNSDYAMIENNNINVLGHTYIYGIILSGENFNIANNVISSESDNFYANGIDIEGPASGVIDSNNISVKSAESAYAIYSGMNGADVFGHYSDNNINAKAYNVFGMSLGDVESNVINNSFNLEGNYTTGIAYRGSAVNITGNHIILNSSEEGNLSVWENFGVEAVGVKVVKGDASIADNVITGPGKGVSLNGAEINAVLENNFINVVANDDKDAYAIYATDVPKLTVSENNIDYQGTTKGTGINNAVYLNNATDAIIANNKIDLDLVSSYVPWAEVPAGSGNWVSSPVSEGIVIDGSNGVAFDGNNVTLVLGDVVGSYDTIYAIDFKNSNDAVITNNVIDVAGETYIYGIIISGNDFVIRANNITSVGNYYADGIDIEGPATGVVEDNAIDVKATNSSYAIYSGMNGADVKANYTGNTIKCIAYNVFGFSLGDVESKVIENKISLEGNYTTGIAYRGSNIVVDNNVIAAKGSNVGNETVWENFGVESIGVKVINGTSTITNNHIETTGDYAVTVKDTTATVTDNYLGAKKAVGDRSVISTGNAVVANNIPDTKIILAAADVYTEYVDGAIIGVIALDENGDPLSNVTLFSKVNGVVYNETTDEKGYAAFVLDLDAGNYVAETYFEGDANRGPKSIKTNIFIDKSPSELIAPASKTVFLLTVKSGSYVSMTLKDFNDNLLANKKVAITFNGETKNYTTNDLGVIKFKLSATAVGTYTLKMKFVGDNNYVDSEAETTVKITKQATKITAAKKTFKAKTKTKKYTITLKNSKGKVIKKAKVTLKVKGKTYKAITNSKGKATFKITKLTKKGKYVAKIKFVGSKYYKASTKSLKYITIK